MSSIQSDRLEWMAGERGVRECTLLAEKSVRLDLVEVESGGYIPPNRRTGSKEMLTVVLSAGAQLRVGDKVYRPTAGQIFERPAGQILAVTNDSHHPFRYSVLRLDPRDDDLEWVEG